MKSRLFHLGSYLELETRIRDFLNLQEGMLSQATAKSSRAAGDAIQEVLSDSFSTLLGSEHCSK